MALVLTVATVMIVGAGAGHVAWVHVCDGDAPRADLVVRYSAFTLDCSLLASHWGAKHADGSKQSPSPSGFVLMFVCPPPAR